MNPELFAGQAITCGGWSIALNMQWANTIVDTFELVKIPRAPNWLIGATNIDGNIVPVVDLSVYFVPNAPFMAIDRKHRLLIGGKSDSGVDDAADRENVFAILFSGLPMQIEYTRESMEAAIVIPERLRELCLGMAKSSLGSNVDKVHFEMNTDRFVEYLSQSLM
jgi:chemotaxis signal transduction protein